MNLYGKLLHWEGHGFRACPERSRTGALKNQYEPGFSRWGEIGQAYLSG